MQAEADAQPTTTKARLLPWAEVAVERRTVVTGAAGSGKTVLLRQWYRELEAADERPVWMSASTRSDREFLQTPLSPDSDLTGGRTLFVDEVDYLDRSAVDRWLSVAATDADHAPSRLVISSRDVSEHMLDLSLGGSLHILDLDRFPLPAETVADILLRYRPDLDDDDLDQLHAALGGWPAGAHLAGRAISDRAAPASVDTFDGADLRVSAYLDLEVFSGLDRLDQQFLVTCSVLDELTEHACAALTGDRLSRDRLGRLRRRHALIEGPNSDGAYTWRPLAQSYLQGKLSLHPHDEVIDLRRRAQDLLAAAGDHRQAIRLAGESSDWSEAARLVIGIGLDLVAAGDATVVLRWIDEMPTDIRRTDPDLAVLAAVAGWIHGGHEALATVEDWLTLAETVGPGRSDAGALPATAPTLLRSLLRPTASKPATALDGAESFRATHPDWHALELTTHGLNCLLDDDMKQSRWQLSQALRVCREEPGWVSTLLGPSVAGALALIEQEEGDDERATLLLSVTPEALASADSGVETDTGILALARARQAHSAGELETARVGLEVTADTANLAWVRALSLIELASLHRQQGALEASSAELGRVDALLSASDLQLRMLLRRRRAVDRQPSGVGRNPHGRADLTDREFQVLLLLDSDLTRREIGSQLFLAHNTVKTYIQRLYYKLEVSSRPEALAKARQYGWLD